MLENIKLVLGLEDTSKDSLINYYINVYSKKILSYCNLIELPIGLNNIIEEMVIAKMKGIDNNVKSETIGDYSVTYNVLDNELQPYKPILNKFRRVKFV